VGDLQVNTANRTGAAHAGLIEWLIQRLTAVYMILFVVVFVFVIGNHVSGFTEWSGWFAKPVVRWAWMLFYISALWHGWIGLRSIFLDYIKPFWLRLTLTLGSALLLFVQAMWATGILFNLGGAA
jgi:succinate dehydrogenase / fumarate reductase membrane anchor subunit